MSYNSINEPSVGKHIPNTRLHLMTRRVYAFTLVELVVTLAVAAILITVAAPNLRTFIQNTRIITQVNALKTDLTMARNKSIGSPAGIGVCRSINGTSCAGGGLWANGRLIFVDSNNNRQWDAGEIVLQFREALVAGNTLTTTPAIPDPLIFSQGMASNLGAGAASFIFCDNRGPTFGKQINFLTATGLSTVDANAPGGC